jgi:hypothetical protein
MPFSEDLFCETKGPFRTARELRMQRFVGLAVLMWLIGSPACAQSTGDELFSQCQLFTRDYKPVSATTFETSREPLAWQCFGYVSAFMQVSLLNLDGQKTIRQLCLPNGVSVVQLIRVVVSYGNAHPEQLHTHAALFTLNAFIKAFPCQ